MVTFRSCTSQSSTARCLSVSQEILILCLAYPRSCGFVFVSKRLSCSVVSRPCYVRLLEKILNFDKHTCFVEFTKITIVHFRNLVYRNTHTHAHRID